MRQGIPEVVAKKNAAWANSNKNFKIEHEPSGFYRKE
jgi:hypothetical protein